MEVALMKSKEDVNILFKQGDTDERILKSMAEDTEHEYNSEELSKALDKAKLVQKEVQVRGKNGQMHTRKQWVKAGEDQPTTKQPKAQEDTKDKKSRKVTCADDVANGIKSVNRKIKSELGIVNSVSSGSNLSGDGVYGCEAHIFTGKLGGDNKAKTIVESYLKKEFGNNVKVEFKEASNEKGHLIASVKVSDNKNDSGSGGDDVSKEKTPTPAAGGSGGDDGTVKGKGKTVNMKHWTKVGTSQEAKAQIAQMLASGKSREDCMSDFKAQGVAWKEHENPAINWMRAAMAMNKHLTSGATEQLKDSDSVSKTEESKENTKSSKEDKENNSENRKTEYENGHIDKDGDLVVDDKSDLGELVSEITGTDSFDQKDLALEELEKNSEYKGAFIEEMGIDKASQNKDGSISVTAYVRGYIDLDTDDGDTENFDTYVTFDIPVKSAEEKTAEKKSEDKQLTYDSTSDAQEIQSIADEIKRTTIEMREANKAYFASGSTDQDAKAKQDKATEEMSKVRKNMEDMFDNMPDGTVMKYTYVDDEGNKEVHTVKFDTVTLQHKDPRYNEKTTKQISLKWKDTKGKNRTRTIQKLFEPGMFVGLEHDFSGRGGSGKVTDISIDYPSSNSSNSTNTQSSNKSVIGSDYTQLTTEKESGTIEGEAHNMMVGWLKSENGGNKKPTESQIKQAANSLKDAAIKRVISSYNQDELVHQLAMAKHFTKLAGGNMDHMTLERTYQDVVSGSSYTQEQKCNALAKLCGKDYDSTGDYVRKYASNSMANASIVPMSKGYFEVTFSYDDGVSRKERFDSVKSAKEAADKFIEKEEKYAAEKKSK